MRFIFSSSAITCTICVTFVYATPVPEGLEQPKIQVGQDQCLLEATWTNVPKDNQSKVGILIKCGDEEMFNMQPAPITIEKGLDLQTRLPAQLVKVRMDGKAYDKTDKLSFEYNGIKFSNLEKKTEVAGCEMTNWDSKGKKYDANRTNTNRITCAFRR